jgi:hypothetical protein
MRVSPSAHTYWRSCSVVTSVVFCVFTVTGLEAGAGGGGTAADLSDNSMEGKGLETWILPSLLVSRDSSVLSKFGIFPFQSRNRHEPRLERLTSGSLRLGSPKMGEAGASRAGVEPSRAVATLVVKH